MKRIPLKKDLSDNEKIFMTKQNLQICIENQNGYSTQYLNDSLHLQFYSFCNIANLDPFYNSQIKQQEYDQQTRLILSKGVNTIFLNNNLISKIQNLQCLKQCLKTLNLSHNKIEKIEGLNQLVNLAVIDLSHNQIQYVPQNQISGLINLVHLNLGYNKLAKFEAIQGLLKLNKTLQFLSLISNQNLQQNPKIITEILSKLNKIKIVYLKDTQFSRKTPSYRKQVILAVQTLTFLDDRPVTADQRLLAAAWKRGGLIEQRQARKLITQQKHEKNAKILHEIQERNRVVDQKVQKIFNIKAVEQQKQLDQLLRKKESQDYELLNSEDQQIIDLRIQDLKKYLYLFKQDCKLLDLDLQLGLKKVQLPKMLVQNKTQTCIYIYNVSQEQLQLIKQKYYPEQVLPLKAVNYQKQQELRWISDYRSILAHIYKISRGNIQMIQPMFNLEIYEFDLNTGRKLKRFKKDEIQQLIHTKLCIQFSQRNSSQKNQTNELDSLD